MEGFVLIPPDVLPALVHVVINGEAVAGDLILRRSRMRESRVEKYLIIAIVTGEDEILLLQLLKQSLRIVECECLAGRQELVRQPGGSRVQIHGGLTEGKTKSIDHLFDKSGLPALNNAMRGIRWHLKVWKLPSQVTIYDGELGSGKRVVQPGDSHAHG